MFSKIIGNGAAAAILLAVGAVSAQAMPIPAPHASAGYVAPVYCAVGMRIGPLGACVGAVAPRPVYVAPHPAYRHCWINNWGHRVCN